MPEAARGEEALALQAGAVRAVWCWRGAGGRVCPSWGWAGKKGILPVSGADLYSKALIQAAARGSAVL